MGNQSSQSTTDESSQKEHTDGNGDSTKDEVEEWCKDAHNVECDEFTDQACDLSDSLPFPLGITPDTLQEICKKLEVEAIVALAATCQAFHSFQKTNDSYFWGQLVMRDYRFILVGEAQRKAQIKLEAEGKTKFKLKVRREDLPQALGSYRNLYAEVSKCLQTAPAGIREVRPYAAMFLNHTTFVRYVFAAYDMIRGVNSWDGDIIVQYGDSVQTNVMVLDFGCNKTVYLHAQLVKWSFGLADMYKGMGLQGDAVSERTCLRWSYWQTFKPRTDYSGYYLSKINSTNNAVKWSTTGHYFVKQWVKTRFYLSLDAPFQNPGPYPAVRVKDSETDEKPYFEFLYQIDNA